MNKTELKSKLDLSIQFLESQLSKIRTGRANPSIIEGVEVNAYGQLLKIRELGSINVLDSQTLVITPWDKSLIKEIVKSIREASLGLNPVADSDVARVPVPALTEERRKEYAKLASTKVEESKNTIRSIRQDFIKSVEKSFAAKEISEDEKFTKIKEIEQIIKEYTTKADELGEIKKKELLSI